MSVKLLTPAAFLAAVACFMAVSTWTQADGSGPRIALNLTGGQVSCDSPAEPASCTVMPGATFTLSVDVIEAPEPGYIAIQTDLYFGGLVYQPLAVADELVWPDGALPLRSPVEPGGQESRVSHGDSTAFAFPFPPSGHVGPAVELNMACPPGAQRFKLALLPYSPSNLLGAGFRTAGPDGGLGDTVPAKTAGQQQIDLDGDTTAETVDVAATIDLTCGEAAAATPTPTFTQTPTASPKGVIGDADCSGEVNSIDAALILQFVAALVGSLQCGQLADANADAFVDVVDAALILQLDAGIISALPP